ncbi:hypothetical protein D187_010362 [Cystobacter fuscus DSM 2262]|uniref:Uncharacterized protein n=1 Tax=Cystobacter fuscus (strain ATCC 25194 / DSM 2262 / NBRC 100088 / M29) TaxID=1242864 RepID=S9QYJ7_CYSF2|nr:hypothetical protein D187_010362 [Cystobacter fuscus DSM 2262]
MLALIDHLPRLGTRPRAGRGNEQPGAPACLSSTEAFFCIRPNNRAWRALAGTWRGHTTMESLDSMIRTRDL